MSDIEKTLNALEQAVRLAPQQIPLVQHFVDTLLELTRFDHAERVLRELLASHSSVELQVLLAQVYYRAGKDSHAMAILETLAGSGQTTPRASLLESRLLNRSGDVSRAISAYRRAVEEDESLRDAAFESLLGLDEPEDDDEVQEGRIRMLAEEGEDGDLPATVERPKISFENVGGMESVKEEIRVKIIYPITHAEMFAAYGKKTGGGILMYGPPGCGKTFVARATAGEVKANFIVVGINDILDMWLGNSERNLARIFKEARENRPCVLFFDEVDALGASRSDMRQSSGRHLINQFLSELDGATSDNEGVLVLGATNAPWHVDSAFRRPGRFDRVLFVPPPDTEARIDILKLQLKGKPIESIDYQKVAARTQEFSGADLSAVIDIAVEAKLQEAVKSGLPKPITTADLLAAAKKQRPSTKEWFASARNHALYANQGGIYDDILKYMKLK